MGTIISTILRIIAKSLYNFFFVDLFLGICSRFLIEKTFDPGQRVQMERYLNRAAPLYPYYHPGFWLGLGRVPPEEIRDHIRYQVSDALLVDLLGYFVGLGMEQVLVVRKWI
ncbi:hypothetical protein XPA_000027 [Xanthoria parietina]